MPCRSRGAASGARFSPAKIASTKKKTCFDQDSLRLRLASIKMVQGTSVADMAVQSDVMEAAGPYDRARALNAFKLGDVTFYLITRLSAISVLLILGGIILSLIACSWAAMRAFGFSFLLTARWGPAADPPVLGALGPIYGTLV